MTGSNLKSLRAAQTSALRGLAIAGFFVVLSMLAVGYFLSRASQVKLERMEAAIESYDEAIAANDSLTLAYLHKGAVCNRLQRHREALECYEKALQTEHKS